MMAEGGLDLESVIESGPISRFQIRVFLICALIVMIDGFDTQSIALVAPDMIADWHVQASAFGPVFGIGLFGGLTGGILFGMASDRFGRKPMLLLAILLFAVMSLTTSYAGSISGLLVIRFLTGLGLGGALPSAISLTSEYAPRRARATIIAWMFCGFPLGATIGGFAASRMIPIFGWESIFIAGGAIPLLLLPWLAVAMPESLRQLSAAGRTASVEILLTRMARTARWNGKAVAAPAEARSPLISLFTDGRAIGTLLIWTTLFFSLLMTYFLINWIPLIARRGGIGMQGAVLGVAAFNLGTIVGCLALGRLVERYRPELVIAASYAAAAIAILSLGYVGQSGKLLFAAAFAAGLLGSGAQMCMIALGAVYYEARIRATGVGWSMAVSRIGGITGPVIGGLLVVSLSSAALFGVAATASLVAAGSVLTFGAFRRRQTNALTARSHPV